MGYTPFVPIYINKPLILDYLSAIGEGYIESLTIKHSNNNNGSVEINNDRKVQNTSADKADTNSCGSSQEYELNLGSKDECDKKKIFSTFYFFTQVKDILYKKKMLRNINESDIGHENIRNGEFIEFTSSLSGTSVLAQINTIIDVLNSYDIKLLDSLLNGKLDGPTNYTVILNQLKNLSGILGRNNTNDVVMNLGSLNAVLTLCTNNFTDKNAYIYDTEGSVCTTLCKVVHASDRGFYIDLLRKTANSRYYNSLLASYGPYFKILNDNNVLVPNNLITKINGPAPLCIPLAMYI